MSGDGQSYYVLKLMLHGELVGYLTGANNGRNTLTFAESFRKDPRRATFSLTTHPDFPGSAELMAKTWVHSQKLHPILANLLPEGALREYLARALKVSVDQDFFILAHLGHDLPGAIVAEPVTPGVVPKYLIHAQKAGNPQDFGELSQGFSLAGVQMKFSMKEWGGRFTLANTESFGDWIVKTPSTVHKNVPQNEYTAMSLAAMAGIDVPEFKLIDVGDLEGLPQISMPDEKFAYGIKRFDRSAGERIHTEDFAQILMKYAHDKYGAANYEQIGKILFLYSGEPLADGQQMAARLLVNVLLANGDAHLKNWSVIYQDKCTPRLAPAYDIVTTKAYINDESDFALNLGKAKSWDTISFDHFESWSRRTGFPWPSIKICLSQTLEKARDLWPSALASLPMMDQHKDTLKRHWQRLPEDFRIPC